MSRKRSISLKITCLCFENKCDNIIAVTIIMTASREECQYEM